MRASRRSRNDTVLYHNPIHNFQIIHLDPSDIADKILYYNNKNVADPGILVSSLPGSERAQSRARSSSAYGSLL